MILDYRTYVVTEFMCGNCSCVWTIPSHDREKHAYVTCPKCSITANPDVDEDLTKGVNDEL